MDYLPLFPDNYFDLAIVDPPYFSGPERREYYGRKISPIGVQRYYEPSEKWEVPGLGYFQELERVSKEQIVWGCNYFDYHFPPGRIVWDKCNGGSSFSDCEIASCSLHDSVRLFRYMWNGMFLLPSSFPGTSRSTCSGTCGTGCSRERAWKKEQCSRAIKFSMRKESIRRRNQ